MTLFVYNRLVGTNSPRSSSVSEGDGGSTGEAQKPTPTKQRSESIGSGSSPKLSKKNARSGSHVIELKEEITPMRPKRPKSRPFSGTFKKMSLSVGSLTSTESSTSAASAPSPCVTPSEEPPPLPEKKDYADYSNLPLDGPVPDLPPRANSLIYSDSHRNKPAPPLPASAPPPVEPSENYATLPEVREIQSNGVNGSEASSPPSNGDALLPPHIPPKKPSIRSDSRESAA